MGVIASTTGEVADFDIEPLARDAQAALDAAGHGEWELSLLICDDAFIRPLNQQWRDKDQATDVLSFPQLEYSEPERPVDAPEGTVLLGDVVISLETAEAAAKSLGHSLHTELQVLVVHGICHLLGHEHGEPEQARTMASRESELLRAVCDGAQGLVARAGANG